MGTPAVCSDRERISPAEDIVRYSSGRFILSDTEVDGRLFAPRPTDDGEASVNRISVYNEDVEAALACIRATARLELRKSGRLVQANVGELQQAASAAHPGHRLEVIADPLAAKEPYPADPSHALMVGLPSLALMDDLLADFLAASVKKLHHAKP